MYTVMVTGGLGSGKSSLRELMCARGATSIDLDAIARTVLDEDAVVSELVERFGPSVLSSDGSVDRGRLAQLAFASDEATRSLNGITFPRILDRATEYVLDVHCTPRSDADVLVVEVPLLTEVPEFAELADEVIAVRTYPELALARAVERGMDAEDALRRMHAQATDTERLALADTVCDNNGTREDLVAWVGEWWADHEARLAE